MFALYARGRIGFYSGDKTKLQEEAHTLRPTVFNAVPRVLQDILHSTYQNITNSKFKTYLLQTAIKQKLKSVNR